MTKNIEKKILQELNEKYKKLGIKKKAKKNRDEENENFQFNY